MRTAVVDSSTIISFSGSCLIEVFGLLKQRFGIHFYVPKAVVRESVVKPSHIKRFELNAIRIRQAITKKFLEPATMTPEIKDYLKKISFLANNIYFTGSRKIKILHEGEAETLALTKQYENSVLVIDERTTKMLVEEPLQLRELLSKRLNKKISFDKEKLREFQELLPDFDIIRSSELAVLAYKHKVLPKEMTSNKKDLKAILYSLKFGGLAISLHEIESFVEGFEWA